MIEGTNLFDTGFKDGCDLSRPLPPSTAPGDYIEGFIRARIKAAGEHGQLRTERHPLPCGVLEVEVVLNHRGPQDALRMIRAESFRSTG